MPVSIFTCTRSGAGVWSVCGSICTMSGVTRENSAPTAASATHSSGPESGPMTNRGP